MDAPPDASRRLDRWINEGRYTLAEAGALFGCSPSYVARLRSGQRIPRRRVALAIEKATFDLEDGPICVREWAYRSRVTNRPSEAA